VYEGASRKSQSQTEIKQLESFYSSTQEQSTI
jgi:hypothetical protein